MTTREEVQYALCWNNFNTNMSTGLYDSLCRDDLVDVTLAADGHLARAHRLVLSLSSPYFQKMFTQMPVNQQAFVLLHDCPHTVLKDLIQFMYCGEVNVAPDDLPAFLKVAEGLQIKGLMENADSTTTAEIQVPSSVTNDSHGLIGAIDPMVSVAPAEMVCPSVLPSYQQHTPAPAPAPVPVPVPALTHLGNSTTLTKRTRKRVSEPVAATTGAARTTENNRRSSKRQKTRVEEPPSEPEQPSEEDDEDDDDNDDSEDNENGEDQFVEEEYNGEDESFAEQSGFGQSYTEADTSVNSTGQALKSRGKGRRSRNAEYKQSDPNISHQVEFISGPTNRIMLVDQYKFYCNKSGKSTVQWFCRLKQQLGCPARVRSNLEGGDVEFMDLNHNHGVGTFSGRGKRKTSMEAVHVKQEPADKM